MGFVGCCAMCSYRVHYRFICASYKDILYKPYQHVPVWTGYFVFVWRTFIEVMCVLYIHLGCCLHGHGYGL